MMLAINKMDGHGTAYSERLPKKTKVTRYFRCLKSTKKPMNKLLVVVVMWQR